MTNKQTKQEVGYKDGNKIVILENPSNNWWIEENLPFPTKEDLIKSL